MGEGDTAGTDESPSFKAQYYNSRTARRISSRPVAKGALRVRACLRLTREDGHAFSCRIPAKSEVEKEPCPQLYCTTLSGIRGGATVVLTGVWSTLSRGFIKPGLQGPEWSPERALGEHFQGSGYCSLDDCGDGTIHRRKAFLTTKN